MRKTRRKKRATKKTNTINIIALLIAVPLFGYGFAAVSSGVFMESASVLTATAVGASASVARNPDNTLAAQLNEKASTLEERESNVAAREQALASRSLFESSAAYISLVGSLVLFVLVGLNFYLDTRRRRDTRAAPGGLSVDMRQVG